MVWYLAARETAAATVFSGEPEVPEEESLPELTETNSAPLGTGYRAVPTVAAPADPLEAGTLGTEGAALVAVLLAELDTELAEVEVLLAAGFDVVEAGVEDVGAPADELVEPAVLDPAELEDVLEGTETSGVVES
jgi:hypothetical protein